MTTATRVRRPAALSAALARIGEELDYDNFKGEVSRHDLERAHVYSKVWSMLGQFQPGGPYGAG